MKILFDINHPVDVNFFKNSIIYLSEKGFNIKVIYRPRGRLSKIIEYELGEFNPKPIGYHAKSFITKIISQIWRDFILIPYMFKEKFDLIVCFGPTSAIAAKILQIPYLAFDDDFEYKIPFYHANWFSTKHIFPDYIEFSNSRTSKFHGFKELAYLHPNYLKVTKDALREYKLESENYVFIREIANISLNYKEKEKFPILNLIIDIIKGKGLKIVLSIEDKTLLTRYNNDCIILKEPVKNLYSLMYFSLFSVSSGDTVARETAILGVPTLYTGGRDMAMNASLISAGVLFSTKDIVQIEKLISRFNLETKIEYRKKINNLINQEWEDTTAVIINHIENYK